MKIYLITAATKPKYMGRLRTGFYWIWPGIEAGLSRDSKLAAAKQGVELIFYFILLKALFRTLL